MDIRYTFSDGDIEEVLALLNTFLQHLSLVPLSRREATLADPNHRLGGIQDSRYAHIEKVVNRWGIRSEDGEYYRHLNDLMGRITSLHPMLGIDKSIQLFLFRRLLGAWWRRKRARCTREEVRVFFCQPDRMISSHSIRGSSIYLHDFIRKTLTLSPRLRSRHAREFLNEGVARRLGMLKVSVDNICQLYDERRIEPMDDNQTAVLSQNINFFYANTYAIVDCLAFVFAYEDPDYRLDRVRKNEFKKVGLFQPAFRDRIRDLDEKLRLRWLEAWYRDIVELRHPVAHRIPLYLPDIYVEEEGHAIQKLDDEYWSSLNSLIVSAGQVSPEALADALEKLSAERRRKKSDVRVFSGCFLHSSAETGQIHHLSRLALDLGIVYHLVDASFDLLARYGKDN